MDPRRWWELWVALCARFSRVPEQQEAAMYLEYLDAMLTPEQIEASARAVWADREFFPRPVDFVNAAHTSLLSTLRDLANSNWKRDANWLEALGGQDSFGHQLVKELGGMHNVENLLSKGAHVLRREVQATMSEMLRARAPQLPPLLPRHERTALPSQPATRAIRPGGTR